MFELTNKTEYLDKPILCCTCNIFGTKMWGAVPPCPPALATYATFDDMLSTLSYYVMSLKLLSINKASSQSQVPSEEASTSSDNVQSSAQLSSRYTVSEEHQKAKEQFMEKERENARMEAKRRKLMEKRVRICLQPSKLNFFP